MPTWMPEAVLITLITVLINLASIVYQRRVPAAKDKVDTSKVLAETNGEQASAAQVLEGISVSLAQRLQERVLALETQLTTVRAEYDKTVGRLEERITLINQQYTDYVLATDVRIEELERENAEMKRENFEIKRVNKELKTQVLAFIEEKERVSCGCPE